MSALDRCLFSLALLVAIFGSIALYAQGREAERQAAAACLKMQLQQMAAHDAL
jgi:hypothetical protein